MLAGDSPAIHSVWSPKWQRAGRPAVKMSTIRVSAMDVARTLTRSEADTCLHVFVTCQLGIPRGRNGVWLLAAQASRDCCMMHVCLWTPQNAANCEFVGTQACHSLVPPSMGLPCSYPFFTSKTFPSPKLLLGCRGRPLSRPRERCQRLQALLDEFMTLRLESIRLIMTQLS